MSIVTSEGTIGEVYTSEGKIKKIQTLDGVVHRTKTLGDMSDFYSLAGYYYLDGTGYKTNCVYCATLHWVFRCTLLSDSTTLRITAVPRYDDYGLGSYGYAQYHVDIATGTQVTFRTLTMNYHDDNLYIYFLYSNMIFRICWDNDVDMYSSPDELMTMMENFIRDTKSLQEILNENGINDTYTAGKGDCIDSSISLNNSYATVMSAGLEHEYDQVRPVWGVPFSIYSECSGYLILQWDNVQFVTDSSLDHYCHDFGTSSIQCCSGNNNIMCFCDFENKKIFILDSDNLSMESGYEWDYTQSLQFSTTNMFVDDYTETLILLGSSASTSLVVRSEYDVKSISELEGNMNSFPSASSNCYYKYSTGNSQGIRSFYDGVAIDLPEDGFSSDDGLPECYDTVCCSVNTPDGYGIGNGPVVTFGNLNIRFVATPSWVYVYE